MTVIWMIVASSTGLIISVSVLIIILGIGILFACFLSPTLLKLYFLTKSKWVLDLITEWKCPF